MRNNEHIKYKIIQCSSMEATTTQRTKKTVQGGKTYALKNSFGMDKLHKQNHKNVVKMVATSDLKTELKRINCDSLYRSVLGLSQSGRSTRLQYHTPAKRSHRHKESIYKTYQNP